MLDVLHICAPNTAYKGLGWNAWHTTESLREHGVTAEWIQAPTTAIVYAVMEHQPKVAVIMAQWVSPEELSRLATAFPATTWIVKNHSGPQFFAQEGKSWEQWLKCGDLHKKLGNVHLAVIRPEDAASIVALGMPCVVLPNVYAPRELRDAAEVEPRKPARNQMINVGVFGACRPIKNVVGMIVAVAGFAAEMREVGRSVTVHCNMRTEMGSANDSDIIADICNRAGMTLAKRAWFDHIDFKRTLATMDVCMAASFSETYSYVAADSVTAGTPVIGSTAIPWLPSMYQVNPDNTEEMTNALIEHPRISVATQLRALQEFDAHASKTLLSTLAEFGVKPAASTKEPISV